jgi:hypothetical protein
MMAATAASWALAASLLAASAPVSPGVPQALTEVNPFQALRWRRVPTRASQGSAGELAAGRVVEATMSASAVLRLRGGFATGCDPLVARRFRGMATAPDTWVEVPVPLSPDRDTNGRDRLLVLPPPLAPDGSDDADAPAWITLTLPAGCPSVPVELYEADDDPDPIAGRRVVDELRGLASAVEGGAIDDQSLIAWLRRITRTCGRSKRRWHLRCPACCRRMTRRAAC